MASVSSLSNISVAPASVQGTTTAVPANASAELAKYESQLSDWVHCASSKTSEGKAKIAEITAKIESIKARVKQAEDVKQPASVPQAAQSSSGEPHRPLRLDLLGTWLDAQA
jgi:peptidyl-tRNA hydrolase